MTVEVTMLQTRWGEDGTLWTVSTTHTASDDFAYFLVGNNFATGRLPVPQTSAPASYLTDATGTYLVGVDGVTLYPLAWIVGSIEEGYVAGAPQSLVSVDSGSDTADHAQILWTANCTLAGNPDTADDALASARMVAYAADSEVYKSGVDGGTSGESFSLRYPSGLTMLHFGLAGGGSYTVAAGNTLTGTQMVKMTFPEVNGVVAVEIKLLTATLGTTGKRYRQIMVTPYGAA